jgi:hypothetical protein
MLAPDSDHGFRFREPAGPCEAIFRNGLATMGGESGTLGLMDPDAQSTTLVAKINHQLVGIFQAGLLWGRDRGYYVKGQSDPDGSTVHAEEYMIAALQDIWVDLEEKGIIREGEKPVLSMKITKSPCPGCKDQLVKFVSDYDVTLRIKAAQLWARRSGGKDDALLAIHELAEVGVVVLPWNVEAKAGKSRKLIYGSGTHELGGIRIASVGDEKLNKLRTEYAELCKLLGVGTEDKYKVLHAGYKKGSLKLTDEQIKVMAVKLNHEALLKTQDKLSKKDSELKKVEKAIELGSKARRSSRSSTLESTKRSFGALDGKKTSLKTVVKRLDSKKTKHEGVLAKFGEKDKDEL